MGFVGPMKMRHYNLMQQIAAGSRQEAVNLLMPFMQYEMFKTDKGDVLFSGVEASPWSVIRLAANRITAVTADNHDAIILWSNE